MQAIQSRLYTNVILTAIAVFLAVLAFRPFLQVSSPAFAQYRDERFDALSEELEERRTTSDNFPQRERNRLVEGAQFDEMAAAIRSVSEANYQIAEAIRDASESQKDIAKSIGRLANQ